MRFCVTFLSLLVTLSVGLAQADLPGPIGFDREGNPFIKGRVLVGLKEGVSLPTPQKGMRLLGGTVGLYMPEIRVVMIEYPVETDIMAKIAQLAKSPIVRFAEPDSVVYATFVPNDPSWGVQWGPQKIGCPAAWDVHKGDAGTVIAIVDTGINYNHPDLSSKYVGGYDFYNNDSNPMDDNGHGTHCAGIAAAATNNSVGIAGVGFNCKLMAVKVLSSGGSGSLSTVAQGINYATTNGAKVINLSLGSYSGSSTLQSAVNNAWNNGVVLAAAAGNDGVTNQLYPAAYTNCIATAASTTTDSRASWSNYGSSWVDVAAPGVSIYSTMGSSYSYLDGTSMASPHVAGAAALLYSYIGGSRSLANAQIVRNALENTCVYVGNWVAKGRINLSAAIQSLIPQDDDFEPNDTCGAAAWVTPGTWPGLIVKNTSEDWYRITVPSCSTLNVSLSFTHANGNVDLEVYDACGGSPVAFSRSTGNSETVNFHNNAPARDFFIRVYLASGTQNTYDMTVGLSSSTAQVTGKVTLQQYLGGAGQSAVMEFRQPGTSIVLDSVPIVLDSGGNYTASTTACTYDVALKFSNWLREVKVGVSVAGTTTLNFNLVNGDANDDNQVNLTDLNLVLTRIGESGSGDLDWDGTVTLADLNIILVNFGLTGMP